MAKSKFSPRGRSLFRQYNMEKLVRSAEAAGLEIGGIEVDPNGVIRVLTKDAAGQAASEPWDKATAKLQAGR